jgi:hypothetical protein
MAQRHFHAHEAARLKKLNGLRLTTFWQRVLGYVVDLVLRWLCGDRRWWDGRCWCCTRTMCAISRSKVGLP